MSASGSGEPVCSGKTIVEFETQLKGRCTDIQIFNGFFNTLENNIVSAGKGNEKKWNAVLMAILNEKTKPLRAELFVRIVLYFQKYKMKLEEEDLLSLFTKLFAKIDPKNPKAVERAGILACIAVLDDGRRKDLIKDGLLRGANENETKTPKKYMNTFFSEHWKTKHPWAYDETASTNIENKITALLKAHFRILSDKTDFSMFKSLKGVKQAKEFVTKEDDFDDFTVVVRIGPSRVSVRVSVDDPEKYVKRESSQPLPMSSLGHGVTNKAYIDEVGQFVNEAVLKLQSDVELNVPKFEVDELMLMPPKSSSARTKLDNEEKKAKELRKTAEEERMEAFENFVTLYEEERAKETTAVTPETTSGTRGSFSPEITMMMQRHDVAANEAEKLRKMLET